MFVLCVFWCLFVCNTAVTHAARCVGGFAEIAYEHLLATELCLFGIVEHGLYFLLIADMLALVLVVGEEKSLEGNAVEEVGKVRCFASGNIGDDSVLRERDEEAVELVRMEAEVAADVAGMDDDGVGEDTRVVAEKVVDEEFLFVGYLFAIELFAAGTNLHARRRLLLIREIPITGLCDELDGGIGREQGKFLLATEKLYIECKTLLCAETEGYFIVVANGLIHLLEEGDGREAIADTFLDSDAVRGLVEEYGIGGLAIASCTTGFLKIGLDGVGKVDMDDRAYVGFVDTHTEGIGSYHYAFVALHPGLKARIFLGIEQTCMEEIGGDACLVEEIAYLAGLLAVAHIDHTAAFNALEDMQEHLGFAFAMAHYIAEVAADEGLTENVFLAEKESLLDIFHHLGRSGGRKG